jgi:aminodeoxyfutalosine deaminase
MGAEEMPPRAELHLHLFGAIPVGVLGELARQRGVELPPVGRYRDFDHFQDAMRALAPIVMSAEDLELVTYELGRELAGQGVGYAEVMTTPYAMEARGVGYPAQIEAMSRARERAAADFGVEMRWIFEIPRQAPDAVQRSYWSDYTTEVAIDGRRHGVVALGLSGSEAGNPPEPFAPWFERALAAGLHSVPHAGEHDGPRSVWGAIKALGAERIAHGVRAIEEPELVRYLAEHRIALDVCPTSNVCLGVVPDLASHPLRRLHQAGVPVTVNSDDPTLFDTSLSGEIGLLQGPLGLDAGAAREVVANGLRYRFAAP